MNVFEAVKQSVTTRQAAEHYGIHVGRNGMACCPFHNDKTPSMKLDRRYHCFGCGADGDVIDFAAALYGLAKKEAAVQLANDFGLSYEDWKPPGKAKKPKPRQKSPEEQFQEAKSRCFRIMRRWNSLLHGPRRYGLPRSRSRWPRLQSKREKKTLPGLRLPRQRRPVMTDSRTLGQSVPKEGLFLMDGIEGLRSLPKHSVDMLLTDPPYGTTRNYWDVPLPLPELWEAVKWAVKPNGAVLFFAQCPFDKVLGASNLAMLRYEWVWYKERGTGFLNANRAPLKKSENILVFYQKSPVYNPQFTYGKPYTRVHSRS